jgi:hypothetical protein
MNHDQATRSQSPGAPAQVHMLAPPVATCRKGKAFVGPPERTLVEALELLCTVITFCT